MDVYDDFFIDGAKLRGFPTPHTKKTAFEALLTEKWFQGRSVAKGRFNNLSPSRKG